MQQQIQTMQQKMQQEIQRLMNRSWRNTADPITPLIRLGNDGALALPDGWFPQNQDDLAGASEINVESLHVFYGLANYGTLDEKSRN
jgi:Protein of unknown function (DUF3294)